MHGVGDDEVRSLPYSLLGSHLTNEDSSLSNKTEQSRDYHVSKRRPSQSTWLEEMRNAVQLGSAQNSAMLKFENRRKLELNADGFAAVAGDLLS